jgi:hypothetical protein
MLRSVNESDDDAGYHIDTSATRDTNLAPGYEYAAAVAISGTPGRTSVTITDKTVAGSGPKCDAWIDAITLTFSLPASVQQLATSMVASRLKTL